MTGKGIDAARLAAQELRFKRAFESGDLDIARPLYQADVVYVSPTVRLFDWPSRIEGIERTLEFIRLTVASLREVTYEAVEEAVTADQRGAFVRIHFDWQSGVRRLRSSYVVLYRYREGLIARQELYYDPSGQLEVLGERC